MSFFTRLDNIFDACIENLSKLIYSIKRIMQRAQALIGNLPHILMLIISLLVAIAISAFSARADVGDDVKVKSLDGNEATFVFLEANADGETDSTVISVKSVSESGFCGILVELNYDSEVFDFVSLQKGEGLDDGFEFDCLGSSGKIRFVADSCENVKGGEIFKAFFKTKEKDYPEEKTALFNVSCEAYTATENGIFPIEIFCESILVNTNCNLNLAPSGGIMIKSVKTAKESDEYVSVRVEGIVSRGFAFAGVNVTIINFDTLECESFSVTGSPFCDDEKGKRFLVDFLVKREGEYTIIARPVARGRIESVFGEEKVFVIKNGCQTGV